MISSRVQVRLPEGGEQEWLARFSDEEPWFLEVTSPGEDLYFATADNLFEALRQVRRQLEAKGILLCCNGARANARPSGLLASYGADFVYLIPAKRLPTRHDIVPLFGLAPAAMIVSVAEQDQAWERLTHSGSWKTSSLNPANWWQRMVEAAKGPMAWVPETDTEGMTTWRRVFPRWEGVPDRGQWE